jgi:hypothetical protein
MSTSEVLDAEIRALVIELVESAPPAPSPSAIESSQWDSHRSRRKLARTRRRLATTSVGVVVAIAIVLLAVLLPSAGQRLPVAAAAQLRLIAANASNQPVLTLGRDQWLEVKTKGMYTITVTSMGSRSVSGGSASIPVSSTDWSDNFGQTCWTREFGQAQFASPSNQAAWTSVGLSTRPTHATLPNCQIDSAANARNGAGLAFGAGVTDVSSLPTDPSTLARELTTGTTGIAGIDGLSIPPGENPGFARVVPLLVGPLTGSSPALNAAIFKALALMPGVQALGETATHTGTTGLGFDAPGASPASDSAIVVDQNTGALLEARNLELFAPDVLSPFMTSAFPGQGFGGQFAIQWIDPSSPAQVVDSTSLPSEIHPVPPPTAVFTAIAKPDASSEQISALGQQLTQEFGTTAFGGIVNEQPQSGAPTTITLTYTGPASQVQAVAEALRMSPIVASVTVDNGDG